MNKSSRIFSSLMTFTFFLCYSRKQTSELWKFDCLSANNFTSIYAPSLLSSFSPYQLSILYLVLLILYEQNRKDRWHQIFFFFLFIYFYLHTTSLMQHNMMVRCKNIVRGSTTYVCILDEWVWGNSCKTDNRRRQLLTIITSKWQNMMKLADCFIHKKCGCKHGRAKKKVLIPLTTFFLFIWIPLAATATACVFPSSWQILFCIFMYC
jgi:hypothetical protein